MTAKGIWLNETEFIAFGAQTKEIAVRSRSMNLYGMLRANLSNPDPVLKKQGKDISIYRQLLYHPHVSACVEQLTDRVTALEWDIDRGRSKSRSAKLVKEIFQDLDRNQDGGITKLVADIINARLFGYQPFEILRERIGRFLSPVAVLAKPQEWFLFSEKRELLFKSRDFPLGGKLPPLQFITATHKSSYLNPYGIAQLSACLYPVLFERGAWQFRTVFVEKYGMPGVVIKVRRGTSPEEADKILADAEAAVQDSIILIPEDASAELMKANDKSSSEIYHDYKIDCENDISKSILGSTLAVQSGDVGSYALGKVHENGIDTKAVSTKQLVCQTLNKLIHSIYQTNELSGDEAEFVLYEEEQVDKARAERDSILTQAGVKFNKIHFVEEYGFEEDEFEVGATGREEGGEEQPETEQTEKAKESEQLPESESDKATAAAGAVFAAFAKAQAQFKDQEAVDNLLNSVSPATLQTQLETALTPVFALIKAGQDFEFIKAKLASVLPKMPSDELEETLTNLFFITEVFGRLTSGGK